MCAAPKLIVLSMIMVAACGQGAARVSSDDPAAATSDAAIAEDEDDAGDAGTTSELDAASANVMDAGSDASASRVGCGDRERAKSEACDDGNRQDGDGCSRDCLAVEQGFSCQPAGSACRRIARCGDGVIASTESCDDGNMKDGDGCSARCRLEPGFQCSGQPGVCTATHCGDGKVEGLEACDDGNQRPFDGCSADCQSEPVCPANSACASRCGDGLVLNEECDDGNVKDGDGCSAQCRAEAGFACSNACDRQQGVCALRVPVIYRDFQSTHPDFAGLACLGLTQGMVAESLSAQQKPVFATAPDGCVESASSFAEWYTDGPRNVSVVSQLTLYEDGMGGFVNRYGPDGARFPGLASYSNIALGGPAGMGCAQCTPSAQGRCFDPCIPGDDATQACCADVQQELFDGNPLFFPLDDDPRAFGDERLRARLAPQYGYPGDPWEDDALGNARLHNFRFTTEVVYWFSYQENARASLTFTGDDDVWVFVNGKLAVDLGGRHPPVSATLLIDQEHGPRYGLTSGQVYQIRVFHAERAPDGSTFRLTLAGFNTARSECSAHCGDAIVTAGEECDDGQNDGGYEECAPGCMLGPRCGDGVLQAGEDCDDGNRREGDDCGSSCRKLELL
jgi:fibro-slime domain-containing protein